MTHPALALFRWVDSLPSSSAYPGHLDCRCGNCPEPARKPASAVAGRPSGLKTWNGTAQPLSAAHGADDVEVCQ